MPSQLCPLCGHPLVGDLDRDHVFGEAFGGRATVETHRACNNALGSGAEGRLHRANSVLNFVASANGLSKSDVIGTTADGARVSTDFASGQVQMTRPRVEIKEDAENITLAASGRKEVLQGVLRDWRGHFGEQVPTWDQLSADQHTTVEGPVQEVQLSLSLDLVDAEAFAIKTALDAGVLAFGPEFAGSPLADSLRQWASQPFDNPLARGSVLPRRKLEALGGMEAWMAQMATQFAGSGKRVDLPHLMPQGTTENQVVFISAQGRTQVFVHVLGFPVMPYGLDVDGTVPSAIPGMSIAIVLVRERDREVEIVDFAELLMRPVVEAASGELGQDDTGDGAR